MGKVDSKKMIRSYAGNEVDEVLTRLYSVLVQFLPGP